MTKNIYVLWAIFLYAIASMFFGLWALYHVHFVSGLVIFITHFLVLGFTAQKIEDKSNSKSE